MHCGLFCWFWVHVYVAVGWCGVSGIQIYSIFGRIWRCTVIMYCTIQSMCKYCIVVVNVTQLHVPIVQSFESYIV